MIIQKKTANAIGGKTARACESCLKKRARWFCPADDAFLCHSCDSLVHSANELAGRHKRVRLESASSKPNHNDYNEKNTNPDPNCTHLPAPWHQGFTRKARTPRNAKRAKSAQLMMPVVPEISGDEGSAEEENEEQMIFSVPTFDPFEVELNSTIDNDDQFNISLIGFEGDNQEGGGLNDWDINLPEFLPSDSDFAEFAADVESLLVEQDATDEDRHQMYATLPLTDKDTVEILLDEEFNDQEVKVKVEERESGTTTECSGGGQFDYWSLDYDQVKGLEEEEEEGKKLVQVGMVMEEEERGSNISNDNNNMMGNNNNKRRKIFLRLNYEEVIDAWAGSSPWTTGRRPEFDPEHDGWPNCMGVMGSIEAGHEGGEVMMGGRGHVDGGDGNREARVSRYREKRRTRLFSKKIRYEVRKLNAEKRPRLKGRFVKRTSLAQGLGVGVGVGVGPTFHNYLNK